MLAKNMGGGKGLSLTFQNYFNKSMIKECAQVVNRKWAM